MGNVHLIQTGNGTVDKRRWFRPLRPAGWNELMVIGLLRPSCLFWPRFFEMKLESLDRQISI